MTSAALPLKFQVGARTLLTVRRRLVRVPLSLADILSGRVSTLPPLDGAQGHLVTSLPEALLPALAADDRIVFVRQRYTRHYAALQGGFDAYLARLSSNLRSGLKRKAKRIAAASGGAVRVTAYHNADALAAFHPLARTVAARTYQERLLGSALPATPAFVAAMMADAAADRVRAWLLWIGDVPAAYLYCPADGDTLLYQYVGHDPAFAELSPGTVLMAEAFRDLFGEGRFARFDFTEGEGQHKRQFATDGVACVDLLLLRPTVANRLLVVALAGFDGAVAAAKTGVARLGLADRVRRLRRG